jgi:hypothetical protein
MPDVIGSTMETGDIPIEIEKDEIMTDENNIPKAIGTKKHKDGGTIVYAKEGYKIHNSQAKGKKERLLNHLFKANVNGNPKSIKYVNQAIANLPSDNETPTTDPFDPTEGEGGVKTAKHGMVMSAEEGLEVGDFDLNRARFADQYETDPFYSRRDEGFLEGREEFLKNAPLPSEFYPENFGKTGDEFLKDRVNLSGDVTLDSNIKTPSLYDPNKSSGVGITDADWNYYQETKGIPSSLDVGIDTPKAVDYYGKQINPQYHSPQGMVGGPTSSTPPGKPFSKADLGQEYKMANNPLKYAPDLFNLSKGAEQVHQDSPYRYNPMLSPYKDQSGAARKDVLQSASLSMASLRGKGLTAGQLQSSSAQAATRASKNIAKINELERKRQIEKANRDVNTMNEAQLKNIGFASKARDDYRQALAKKDEYTYKGLEGISKKSQYTDLAKNKHQYDVNRSKMDKFARENFIDTEGYAYDEYGNRIYIGSYKGGYPYNPSKKTKTGN